MRVTKQEAREVGKELTLALTLGAISGFTIPSEAVGRIDEMLVTFLSIILAAAIPGVAITAAAARPPVGSIKEANRLGEELERQVRFWFGFLLVGGLSVGAILLSSALDWKLPTPRPQGTPAWVPYGGGAWLVFATVSTVSLTVVRTRHVANAVVDLVRLGTKNHVAQAQERERQIDEEVRKAISAMPAPAPSQAISRQRSEPKSH